MVSHLAEAADRRHAVGLGDLEADVAREGFVARCEFWTQAFADLQLRLPVLFVARAEDLLVHRRVDVRAGADVGRHRHHQVRDRVPARFVGRRGLARLVGAAGALQFVEHADAHEFGCELTPHPLRVRDRRELEVDVERVWHAALLGDRRLDVRAVALRLRLQRFDAEPDHLAAFLGVARSVRVLRQSLERALQREPFGREDRRDFVVVRQRGVVAVRGDAAQAAALHRVRDDQRRRVLLATAVLERLEDRLMVVAADVVEELDHFVVGQRLDELLAAAVGFDHRCAHRLGVALPDQRLEVVVGELRLHHGLQRLAALLGEHRLAERAVAQLDDFPAVGDRGALDAVRVRAVQAAVVGDARAVEVLAVVVDDPRHVAEFALRDLGHDLEQRAFAELAVAHHAPEVRLIDVPAVLARVAIREREVDRVDGRDADRARRQEAPTVRVHFGVVALEDRLAVVAEAAQAMHDRLGFVLVEPAAVRMAEQSERVVERVVDRRRVRLAAHEVARFADEQVQHGEEVEARRAGRRVAADLGVGAVRVGAVVGDVDHRHHVREGASGDAVDQREVRLVRGLHGLRCNAAEGVRSARVGRTR